ncbi:hypothetical protein [Candidatus Enterovibrio escicola]|uniref:Mobile element protein n=1 Tax=Candidatus Enterovibrio escicola TaxID=1927127 RepID=A0A2A5T2T6_9GAMM|nr:hypothetical protein [Candidatus Enterovibrio escacola]PCS22479.1 hypothetical protein BTN49_1887 [Candidatus Enterovibrio escacola]
MLSLKLTLRDYNDQVDASLANIKAMNKIIRLGILFCQQIN